MSVVTDSSILEVVVAGALGHGRQEVLEHICLSLGVPQPDLQVAGDLRVWQSDALIQERALRLRCLADDCAYATGQDLLVAKADALIFVYDVRRENLEAGWQALQRVAESAKLGGYDLRSQPLVIQYHRCDGHQGFQPSQMDAWLGLPPGEELSRVVTAMSRPDGGGSVFEALWRQVCV